MSVDPFPVYYPRTLANVAQSSWSFASWVPRAVVINLGTNDFSTQPQPTAEQFKTGIAFSTHPSPLLPQHPHLLIQLQGYTNFIAKIRAGYSSYPGLKFFLVCGPLIGNPCCEYIQAVAKAEGVNFHYINMQGILQYPADFGCDGHPNVRLYM